MADENTNGGRGTPVWLTLLNMALAAGFSFTKMGVPAGHEGALALVAGFAGMCGSIVGFKTQRRWGWVLGAALLALVALRFYTALLSKAGLTTFQSYAAWVAYAFICFVAAWIAMLLELFVKRSLQKKTGATDSNEAEAP